MMRIGTDNDLNRETWIKQALAELPKGHRLLDAGAGEQRYRPFCDHLDYVSQDFAQYRSDESGTGLHNPSWEYGQLDIVSDITAIPESDASFDAILCSEVFEHIPDVLAALREFQRLLRPDGRLLLTAPFLSLTHFAPYHYATGFNRYFYETHLPSFGFRVDEIDSNGSFFELVAQEIRRVGDMSRRFCERKPRFWEKWATRIVLRMLSRFVEQDRGSHEVGCYGLHVLATRLDEPALAAA